MKLRRLKNISLSIRTQILLMMFGTIVLVQGAVLYAGNFLKERFLEEVVADHITTTIQIIRSAVNLLPPEHRAEFIAKASHGKWSLWTRQLPQNPRFSQKYRYSSIFPQDRAPRHTLPLPSSNRPPPPPLLHQIFPNLQERNIPRLPKEEFVRQVEASEKTDLLDSPLVRDDLQKLIVRVNQTLDDGTRIGLTQRNNTPLMYLSLLPEFNPFNNTVIKEWLIIPLDKIEPAEAGIFLIAWIALTSLLLMGAGYFAWRITTPLLRLSQSADKLAKGIHAKVVPAGPYETKVLGQRFNAMLNSLEQAKTVQQTLLAGLPHDLKGPLARMRLRLAMTEDEMLKQGMSNDVQEMQNIIEQFISYVRGSDPGRYHFQPLNLNQWIDERANAWGDASSDIVLTEKTTVPLQISADTLALGRLLDNLIGNALKHGKPPVEISLKKTGETALISVSDHGCGIPPERREEALRAFSRLDSARTKTGSVGLGLALVDTIVHAHQGTLELAESSSGGLKVDIYLPLITTNKA